MLLTGATGFVGMEVLVRLLEQTEREIFVLVRAVDDDAARARTDELLETLIAPSRRLALGGRIHALAADLERPGLGLTDAGRDWITGSIAALVHCAAAVNFGLDLATARRINVGGTREILRLARVARDRGTLDRVVHVSTAYVAGERTGRVYERDGDVGQTFRNTYERTKLEAEHLVQASGLPAAILRPSVIVGDSVTGWTPAFSFIYVPLQAYSRGMFDLVAGDPDARVDIVPVDTVADALCELLRGPVRSGPFHVVAGDEACSNERLATIGAEFFGSPAPRFVAPGTDRSAKLRAGVLLPYFSVHCVFDALRGRRDLGAQPPSLEQYVPALLGYAHDARWGRSPLARWAVAGATGGGVRAATGPDGQEAR